MLRDHLYFWCHDAGVYNSYPNLNMQSHCPPEEAANHMGIENIIMVTYNGSPKPPFAAYHERFRSFRKAVWSVIGDLACKYDNDTAYLDDVLALRKQYSNITGGMMDDFFHPGRDFDLATISGKMRAAELPLWVVLYTSQLEWPGIWEKLALCDVINLWTWEGADLRHLERNIAAVREKMPDKKLALGCYLWDFGALREIPPELMEYQCETALRHLQGGSVDDIVILGSPLIGMELPAIEWTRQWIAKNSNLPIS